MAHENHVEGHIHVECDESIQGTAYSACNCCNGFLDEVNGNIYELQEAARAQGLCPGCGSDWCPGGCDDDW